MDEEDMNHEDRRRLIILTGMAYIYYSEYYRGAGKYNFSESELKESEQLKDCRVFNDHDKQLLRIRFEVKYIEGLSPTLMLRLPEVLVRDYAEIALKMNMRILGTEEDCDQRWNPHAPEPKPTLSEEDLVALDKDAEQKGADVCQFVHRLVPIKPTKSNKLMFSKCFLSAFKSVENFEGLKKINSFDVRWIPGLEGKCLDRYSCSNQRWLGRENMSKYRRILLKKILELVKDTTFDDQFKICCEYSRYKQDREVQYCSPDTFNFKKLSSFMFIHFGGRYDLIDILFKDCLDKGTFEQCLIVYNTIHNGRVAKLAIVQLEKLAKTADQHWTIAQIAHRRKDMKLWKRHLKKSAAKL